MECSVQPIKPNKTKNYNWIPNHKEKEIATPLANKHNAENGVKMIFVKKFLRTHARFCLDGKAFQKKSL